MFNCTHITDQHVHYASNPAAPPLSRRVFEGVKRFNTSTHLVPTLMRTSEEIHDYIKPPKHAGINIYFR